MPKVTTAFHKRIVLAFDFDETLAPPTTERLIEFCGYDPESFNNTVIAHEFDGILGGAFHFDEDGNLAAAKRIIPHAEKCGIFCRSPRAWN